MSYLHPNPNCPLTCSYRNGSMCVCNLVAISGEHAPISLGLRIGLNYVYGDNALPPCVHGPLGSAFWSTSAGDEVAGSIETAERFQAGKNEPTGGGFPVHSDER